MVAVRVIPRSLAMASMRASIGAEKRRLVGTVAGGTLGKSASRPVVVGVCFGIMSDGSAPVALRQRAKRPCGRAPKSPVPGLATVYGPGVYICDECVGLCHNIHSSARKYYDGEQVPPMVVLPLKLVHPRGPPVTTVD